jgi:hypothetical protein
MSGAGVGLAVAAAGAGLLLFWPKKKKNGAPGNGAAAPVFPGVPDNLAFGAMGLVIRATENCPAAEASITAAAEIFARDAATDAEAQFRALALIIADLCPGIVPLPGDVEIGKSLWFDS